MKVFIEIVMALAAFIVGVFFLGLAIALAGFFLGTGLKWAGF